MATAVEPTTASAPQLPPARPDGSILPGSLIGAVIVLAGVAAAGYVSTQLVSTTLPYHEAFRLAAFGVVAAAGVFLAGKVAGMNPVRGVSGGIILTVSAVVAIAFIVRAFLINLEGTSFGLYVAAGVLALCLFGVFRMLTSDTGRGWAVALDDQGWASFHSHKRTQGVHVRRYVMIGLLLVGATGAWAIYEHQSLGVGDAVFAVPFTDLRVPLLPARELVVPALIALATLWVAWRAVNMPTFADFLIATEAEMNKVSWTSRKKLIQDTIVVLVTVVLLTLFLLVIDLFWGWLLSRSFVGVLPSQEAKDRQMQVEKLSW
jgi:preprotein translocase SecE subunit